MSKKTRQVIVSFVSRDGGDVLVYPRGADPFRVNPLDLILRGVPLMDVREGDRWEILSGHHPDPQRATLVRIVDPNETLPEEMACHLEEEAVVV